MSAAGPGRALAMGVLRGLWTLEDLDRPGPGWSGNVIAAERFSLRGGASPARYLNLARAWIDANQTEWDQLISAGLEQEQVAA